MAGAKDSSELNSAVSKAAKVAKLRIVREAEESKKVEKAASVAEKFRSELDVLKQRAREVPRTLTDDEIRACEAVKLQMKGKLPEPGKVSVAEVEKIDETVRAANVVDKAKIEVKPAFSQDLQLFLKEKEKLLVDNVINETLSSRGNIISKYTLNCDEALQLGEKLLGSGYKEVRKLGSGVFEKSVGEYTYRFRIDISSLSGTHPSRVPHIHVEILNSNRRVIVNNHIPLKG